MAHKNKGQKLADKAKKWKAPGRASNGQDQQGLQGSAVEPAGPEPGTATSSAVVGLNNLGNTCFFNSSLQLLLACAPLQQLLLQPEHIISKGPIGYALRQTAAFVDGRLASSSARKCITYNPQTLLSAVCCHAPAFKGKEQHDSHELLRVLLDGLQTQELRFHSLSRRSSTAGTAPVAAATAPPAAANQPHLANGSSGGIKLLNIAAKASGSVGARRPSESISSISKDQNGGVICHNGNAVDSGSDTSSSTSSESQDTVTATSLVSVEVQLAKGCIALKDAAVDGQQDGPVVQQLSAIVSQADCNTDSGSCSSNEGISASVADTCSATTLAPATDNGFAAASNSQAASGSPCWECNARAQQRLGHLQRRQCSLLRKSLLPPDPPSSAGKTSIDSVFGGVLMSTIVCITCGHKSASFEPFLDLSLPIPQPQAGTAGLQHKNSLLSRLAGRTNGGSKSKGSKAAAGAGNGKGAAVAAATADGPSSAATAQAKPAGQALSHKARRRLQQEAVRAAREQKKLAHLVAKQEQQRGHWRQDDSSVSSQEAADAAQSPCMSQAAVKNAMDEARPGQSGSSAGSSSSSSSLLQVSPAGLASNEQQQPQRQQSSDLCQHFGNSTAAGHQQRLQQQQQEAVAGSAPGASHASGRPTNGSGAGSPLSAWTDVAVVAGSPPSNMVGCFGGWEAQPTKFSTPGPPPAATPNKPLHRRFRSLGSLSGLTASAKGGWSTLFNGWQGKQGGKDVAQLMDLPIPVGFTTQGADSDSSLVIPPRPASAQGCIPATAALSVPVSTWTDSIGPAGLTVHDADAAGAAAAVSSSANMQQNDAGQQQQQLSPGADCSRCVKIAIPEDGPVTLTPSMTMATNLQQELLQQLQPGTGTSPADADADLEVQPPFAQQVTAQAVDASSSGTAAVTAVEKQPWQRLAQHQQLLQRANSDDFVVRMGSQRFSSSGGVSREAAGGSSSRGTVTCAANGAIHTASAATDPTAATASGTADTVNVVPNAHAVTLSATGAATARAATPAPAAQSTAADSPFAAAATTSAAGDSSAGPSINSPAPTVGPATDKQGEPMLTTPDPLAAAATVLHGQAVDVSHCLAAFFLREEVAWECPKEKSLWKDKMRASSSGAPDPPATVSRPRGAISAAAPAEPFAAGTPAAGRCSPAAAAASTAVDAPGLSAADLNAEDGPIYKQVSFSAETPQIIFVPGSVEQRGTDLTAALEGRKPFCRPLTWHGAALTLTAQLDQQADNRAPSGYEVPGTSAAAEGQQSSQSGRSEALAAVPMRRLRLGLRAAGEGSSHVAAVAAARLLPGGQAMQLQEVLLPDMQGVSPSAEALLVQTWAQLVLNCLADLVTHEGGITGLHHMLRGGLTLLHNSAAHSAASAPLHAQYLQGACHDGAWKLRGKLPAQSQAGDSSAAATAAGGHWEYPAQPEADNHLQSTQPQQQSEGQPALLAGHSSSNSTNGMTGNAGEQQQQQQVPNCAAGHGLSTQEQQLPERDMSNEGMFDMDGDDDAGGEQQAQGHAQQQVQAWEADADIRVAPAAAGGSCRQGADRGSGSAGDNIVEQQESGLSSSIGSSSRSTSMFRKVRCQETETQVAAAAAPEPDSVPQHDLHNSKGRQQQQQLVGNSGAAEWPSTPSPAAASKPVNIPQSQPAAGVADAGAEVPGTPIAAEAPTARAFAGSSPALGTPGSLRRSSLRRRSAMFSRAAYKSYRIHLAPPVLVLHLKRFQLDNRGRLSKLDTQVNFDFELDLGPLMATSAVTQGPPGTAATTEVNNSLSGTIAAQQDGAAGNNSNAANNLAASGDVSNKGTSEAAAGQTSTTAAVPAGAACLKYDLVGLVVHMGTMRGGHYVAYVKRALQAKQQQQKQQQAVDGSAHAAANASISSTAAPQAASSSAGSMFSNIMGSARSTAAAAAMSAGAQWYCISDASVKAVSRAEVAAAQAYMLMYVRRDVILAQDPQQQQQQ